MAELGRAQVRHKGTDGLQIDDALNVLTELLLRERPLHIADCLVVLHPPRRLFTSVDEVDTTDDGHNTRRDVEPHLYLNVRYDAGQRQVREARRSDALCFLPERADTGLHG